MPPQAWNPTEFRRSHLAVGAGDISGGCWRFGAQHYESDGSSVGQHGTALHPGWITVQGECGDGGGACERLRQRTELDSSEGMMRKLQITIHVITDFTPGQIRRLLEEINCPRVSVDWLSVSSTAADDEDGVRQFTIRDTDETN